MAKKKAGGRPSKYKEEFNSQAAKLCKLGATDRDLADFFQVNEDTINEWKKKHLEFSESIKEAKKEADQEVVKALFRRAVGYSHPAVKIFQRNYPRLKSSPTNIEQEMEEDEEIEESTGAESAALVVPYTEHYPPETTACIFWLKNRDRENWKDKHDHELSGNVNIIIED